MAAVLRLQRRGPGKTDRLADLLTRYGSAIEADLQRIYGLELGPLWTDRRRHRRLLNLIEQLPAEAGFHEAVAHDPDVIDAIATGRVTLADEDTDSGPRLTEWTAERAALADIADRISILTIAVLAAGGVKKLPKFTPAARPHTPAADAAARARHLAVLRNADELFRMFAPHAFTDEPATAGP
jgi:hypothetical protein